MSSSVLGPTVSIVIATYNRLPRLQRCIAKIRASVRTPHETIIVGGGTGDGTEAWVDKQGDLQLIAETRREGATRAYNKGFQAARGRFVLWLNDDSWPLPGAVEAAVKMMKQPGMTDVGMVALYHNFKQEWNRLDSVVRDGQTYSIYNVRGYPYANFGLLRRELLEEVNYLDERYYFCAWDPDLALKIQLERGLKVLGCREALVHHEELIDERKAADMHIAHRDNQRLFDKWQLPEKMSYADPAPAYLKMLCERGLAPPESVPAATAG